MLERLVAVLNQELIALIQARLPSTLSARSTNPANAAIVFSRSNFSATPTSGSAPLAVTFNTNVANGYAIDFGDGSTAWVGNEPNGSAISPCINPVGCNYATTYTYTSPGVYTARLLRGGTAAANIAPISLTVAAPGQATNSLSATPTSGSAPLAVTFNTNLANGYAIDFGDGSTAGVGNEPNGSAISLCINPVGCNYATTYTYTSPGVYTARLLRGGTVVNSTIVIIR